MALSLPRVLCSSCRLTGRYLPKCRRDKLPDPVRRHLIDVIIDRTDADGLAANWTAQPVWSHEVSNNDKGEFIRAMFEVLRNYDLFTED